MSRSYKTIREEDLWRLRRLAAEDREDLFHRKRETASMYRHRYFAAALCQGAAQHLLDGCNGVKDFDVWSFFSEAPGGPFPYRRRGKVDFWDTRFGVTPGFEEFVGRRVDMMGRSLWDADPHDPTGSIRAYISRGSTKSARLLALKPVVLLDPPELLGTVVWEP